MKRFSKIILGIIVVVLFCMVFYKIDYEISKYTKTCTVYSIEDDKVTVKDNTGMLFAYYDSEASVLTKGQKLEVTFLDSNIPDRKYDKIIEVKK